MSKRLFCSVLIAAVSLLAASDPLSIRGAKDPDGLKVSAEAAAFEGHFTVVSNAAAKVAHVRAVAGSLVGPDGQWYETILQLGNDPKAQEATVPALGELPVLLKMQMPVPGAYSGSLDLIYDGKRHPTPLTITRADSSAPVIVRAVDTVRASSCWNASPTLRVVLEGTRSEPIRIKPPVIADLALKNSDKVQSTAQFDHVETMLVAPDGTLQLVTNGITLDGRDRKELEITIAGLRKAGEYGGTLLIGAGDFTPKEQAFTIYVKKQWWIAAILILIGIAISLGLRHWAQIGKPRALAQRQILMLLDEIGQLRLQVPDSTEAEQRVLTAFEKRLDDLYEKWRTTSIPADTTVAEIEAKLNPFRTWVNLRRRLSKIEPSAVAAPFWGTLAGFETRLKDPCAPAEVTKISDDLNTLASNITSALQAEFKRQIDVTSKQAEAQRALLAQQGADAYAQRLQTEVLNPLKNAGELADHTRFDEAHAAIDRARLAYARILIEQLEGTLTGAKPDSRITDEDWASAKNQVQTLSETAHKADNADAAVQTWEKAYQVYLSVLLRALSLRIQADSEKVAINATLNADAKAKLGKALESAADAVATSANHLKRSESADAAAAYQEAKNAVEAAETESRSKGVKMGGNGGPDLPPAAASSAAQLATPPSEFSTMCLGSVLHIFKSQSRNWIAERETMNCFSRRWSASFPFSSALSCSGCRRQHGAGFPTA